MAAAFAVGLAMTILHYFSYDALLLLVSSVFGQVITTHLSNGYGLQQSTQSTNLIAI